MAIRITEVHLEGGNTHEHIQLLKWIEDGTGNSDTWTRARLVTWIEDKGGHAYVQQPGTKPATVEVKTPGNGRPKYLQTRPDGDPRNNLLNLPKF
ncbi:DUF3892 domain-containing protein [Nocardia arizonensis]|uniref:DUF3892 domain-containing protein n=1 Tax=Nocardia arizonensis TaxID=1141647 RepID=UPI0006D0D846|nr:DUF3892 domain-containing protein [Nocardia arizonensis]